MKYNLDYVIAVREGKNVYRDSDKAIKLFEASFSKAGVLNEALNQVRVEETGLLIPKLIEVTKIDGKWAIVSEFVEGKTMQALMEENPDKFDEYLDLFVDVQLQIHEKRVPNLNKLKDKMHRKISQSGYNATIRYDLHTRLESMPTHEKVCHGDYYPSNIIIDNEGKPHILDWSHVTQGNASADAARTYMLFRLAGSNEAACKYLRLFCDKSDTARQYVEKWMPIVAAAQSAKDKPEEKEFLEKWVSVVDYQ